MERNGRREKVNKSNLGNHCTYHVEVEIEGTDVYAYNLQHNLYTLYSR